MGFPGGSVSKESACNAGDLGLILDWHIGVSVVYYLNCTFFLQCNFCVWVNWLLLALITEFLNTVYFCRILAEPDA